MKNGLPLSFGLGSKSRNCVCGAIICGMKGCMTIILDWLTKKFIFFPSLSSDDEGPNCLSDFAEIQTRFQIDLMDFHISFLWKNQMWGLPHFQTWSGTDAFLWP